MKNSKEFFDDQGNSDETISDTYADLGLENDMDATISEGNIKEGSLPSQKDRTIIMGKRKEALAWLIRIEKGRLVRKTRLKEGSNLIGRNSKAEVIIDDEEVSEEHARIIKENNHYRIIDLGSLNGTYLNGLKITSPKKLEDEDEIKFANVKFIFKRI